MKVIEIREYVDAARAWLRDYNAKPADAALVTRLLAALNIIETMLPQLIGYYKMEARRKAKPLPDDAPPQVEAVIADAIASGNRRAIPGLVAQLGQAMKNESRLGGNQ